MSNIYIQEPPSSGKVVVKTTVGDIDLELWTKEAPKACRNFIQLCLEGYYDNTIFHRIVKGFIIQGGDPTGTGEGGESIYGEPFKDEFHTRLRFCRRGLLAMANAGKNDNGSQFFFTLAATPELQNKHTIFGKVTGETIFNILKLADVLVDENDRPVYAQRIIKTEVLNNPFDDIVPRTVPKAKDDEKNEKKSKKDKKGVKDFKLLSFGEEAEDDEEETVVITKKLGSKSKSAHDNLSDPKLSSEPVINLDEPPTKKVRGQEENDSDNDTSSEKTEEKSTKEKEKLEMTERVRNKLKSSNKNNAKEINNDEPEEEYFVGKDRLDERKRQTEEIKKEIRNLKREMRDDRNKKVEDDKIKEQEIKKKEVTSELVKEFYETQKEYKKETSKVPRKGASREAFTMNFLNKFKNNLSSVREKCMDDGSSASNVKVGIDDDDPKDDTWMGNRFKCEENIPVLAKDANTKSDDWFEIYDPRNPLNKRRRGETDDSKKRQQKGRR